MKWQNAVTTPIILVAAGLYTTTDNDFLNKYEVREERNERIPHFRTHIDDYLQYAPIAALYGLNALGVKGTHKIGKQTAMLIKSELLMAAMVFPLKRLTAVPRPDTGQPTSFPSGHTAQAFAAATVIHKEYGKEHPIYSVLAYSTASGIGILRVMNNRHWMSDVLAGAGIGILATNIAYLTHHDKPSPGKHASKRDIAWSPSYQSHTFAMQMVISLR